MGAPRLEDLWCLGTDATINGPRGESIPVWIAKPDPVDYDTIVRRCNAKQASVLAVRDETDSEWASLRSDVLMLPREDLIQRALVDFRSRRQAIVHYRVSMQEEWTKDDYLTGLQDAWESELAERLKSEPEDPEVMRVQKELARFAQQVSDELEFECGAEERDLQDATLDDLWDRDTELRLKIRSLMVWQQEFRVQLIFHATREAEDHDKRYFSDVEKVRRCSTEVKNQIMDAYDRIALDVVEGKELQARADSSASSEPAVQEATSDSSGQVLAVV